MNKQVVGALIILLFSVLPSARADTFIVTDRSDSGSGTLREAVAAANTTTGSHLITFNIPGPGSNSITVNTPIVVTNQMTIDGASSQVVGGTGTTALALATGSEGSVLRGLAVTNSILGFLVGSDNSQVMGCRVGVDWNDNTTNGNFHGILVQADDVQIGSSNPADRNIISGQKGPYDNIGIYSIGAARLKIQGNYIGTSSDGLTSVQNDIGIHLLDGTVQCLVGGDRTTGEGNVISGNFNRGFVIEGTNSFGNTICGNIIGLSVDESTEIGNNTGIFISNSSGNFIGLPQSGKQNVICGNDLGCGLSGSYNVVQNNLIGINSSGVTFNSRPGIIISGSGNIIGGDRIGGLEYINIISGNSTGVWITGNSNTVSGNYIGTGMLGTLEVANRTGLLLQGSGNLIGGANQNGAALNGNIVFGSNLDRVRIESGSGNTIAGNYIGLNVNGDAATGDGFGLYCQSDGNLIGGSEPEYRNIISGNKDYGIQLYYGRNNIIQGNYIGTNNSGDAMIKNEFVDIDMYNTSGCVIGGASSGEKNIICGDAVGLSLSANFSGSTEGNTIVGNWLGVLADGTIALEHYRTAIYIESGSHSNAIGLKNTGQGNLIAGADIGIHADGSAATHNAFYGNTICSVGVAGIVLSNGANFEKAPPAIANANRGNFQGYAEPGDYVEVFKADGGGGDYGGSLRYLGSATANAQGSWSLTNMTLLGGEYITAIGTDSDSNSSQFSRNVMDTGPTPTPTPYTGLDAVDLKGKIALGYPNPARDFVNFLFHLEQAAEIKIDVFNTTGERISSLTEALPAGRGQVVQWDCQGVAPGIYFVRIFVEGRSAETHKIAIVH